MSSDCQGLVKNRDLQWTKIKIEAKNKCGDRSETKKYLWQPFHYSLWTIVKYIIVKLINLSLFMEYKSTNIIIITF